LTLAPLAEPLHEGTLDRGCTILVGNRSGWWFQIQIEDISPWSFRTMPCLEVSSETLPWEQLVQLVEFPQGWWTYAWPSTLPGWWTYALK
jgi:hypothetical protein